MLNEPIKIKLDFKSFKELALSMVREDNYLAKVDDWEENILHTEFSESDDYYGRIYFMKEGYGEQNKLHYIKIYSYSYSKYFEKFHQVNETFLSDQVLSKIAILKSFKALGDSPIEKFNEYKITHANEYPFTEKAKKLEVAADKEDDK